MDEKVLEIHKKHTGVLSIKNEIDISDGDDLALAYTPGIAYLSKLIQNQPEKAQEYTVSGKVIAVVTDGSAVLGLGNVGARGGLPIVEGKALIYKCFADVQAFPLCIKQKSVSEFIQTFQNIEYSFAGIHLEDIKAPECFEILTELKKCLDIPVYHDDQEGTAIVVLAGLINAAKLRNTHLRKLKVLINGVGASGLATAKLLKKAGITDMTLVDVNGVLTPDNCLNQFQKSFVEELNGHSTATELKEAIKGQEVFIGLSEGGVLDEGMIDMMADNPIIFALANPVPEIDPRIAKKAGAKIIGTGSSNYPNQINNVLAFPGLFKGLLKGSKKEVSESLQIKVAQTIADFVEEISVDHFIPSVFDEGLAEKIADVVSDFKED
ncbi:NAD(P)-dependent malic enzyme [Vagococcus zengguangii]|uniref:NADP-dependent malic enzyme n=1 Tax=Vagococcus zengguangii TaxID=2571750 RepID=A0A4D7CRG1_9ENTE|nr:NADP-dependent malic enzyme [Vagococcus zengguangii]QCI85593.1 NADP-dependent malic enzyme [Vagococcus zengguangii]TLG79448.1 NADP-dependent malic enzyme [Vagococcus zengguangii]